MIHTKDLTKKFDDFLAVDMLNFTVNPGQVLVMLGPNGAGKTTTVRMLTSILKPTKGSATIAGYDVVEQADKVRKAVGVLTEHHGLYARMTMTEYLDFFGGLYLLSKDETRRRVEPLIVRFNLTDAKKKRLGEFSKGMRQKLALVRALIHDPPVLLLDEPTSAMDPESARMVRDSIAGLRSSDRTIVLCTHNLTEAEQLADIVAIIHQGKIILAGSVPEIKSKVLGEPEYIAYFSESIGGWHSDHVANAHMTGRGDDWMKFRISDPEIANTRLMKEMIQAGLPIVSFQAVPRSLEDAYLRAVRNEDLEGVTQ
ncbi:MAG: ABC transporter ATP-binding protein [Anaerolineae bacterium]|jgi:ABC-2 type transport system ATP-binding protein|nr:ABC transporter ATP-binding protein [Anaerolineae bacterium]